MSDLVEISDALASAAARAAESTVLVDARRRLPASGIAWTGDVVVTANHVVERDEDVSVLLPDGERVSATVSGRDPGSDVAVLRLAGSALSAGSRASAIARVGQIVLALGRPSASGHMASLGIVAAAGGPWRTFRGTTVDGYLRSDATMFPGFSGGPLVDAHGDVLGMNTSLLGQGSGLAIPVGALDAIVADLLRAGHVRRGYLGISTQAVRLPGAFAQSLGGGQESGLLVVAVEPSSPADAGGLLVGDILVGLAGATVASTDDLQAQLGGDRVGSTVEARILRGGVITTLEITVGERG